MERGGGSVGSEHEGGIMLDAGGVAGVSMFSGCIFLSVFSLSALSVGGKCSWARLFVGAWAGVEWQMSMP